MPWIEPPRLRTLEDAEDERRATWLELFFDLVFVVAVALHDDEAVRHDRFSRNARIASFASSPSIDSESQSRAWPTVSCQDRSRHQLSCCFV